MNAMDKHRRNVASDRCRGAVGRLVHGNRGAAAVEYASILALIVATGAGAYLLVGTTAGGFFERTALLIGWSAGPEARLAEGPSTPADSRHKGSPKLPTVEGDWAKFSTSWLLAWAAMAAAALAAWQSARLLARSVRARSSRRHHASTPPSRDLLEYQLAKRQQIRRLLMRSLGGTSPFEAQVRQLMSTDVVCVTPQMRYAKLVQTMADRRIRHLLVCGRNGTLLGIISDRDIKHRHGATAEAIMTRDPFTVASNSPVAPAITQMIAQSISCLPVVSRTGAVRGILTTTDLMLSLQCTLQVFESMASGLGIPAEGPEPKEEIYAASNPAEACGTLEP